MFAARLNPPLFGVSVTALGGPALFCRAHRVPRAGCIGSFAGTPK